MRKKSNRPSILSNSSETYEAHALGDVAGRIDHARRVAQLAVAAKPPAG